jgi:hypothetical protein
MIGRWMANDSMNRTSTSNELETVTGTFFLYLAFDFLTDESMTLTLISNATKTVIVSKIYISVVLVLVRNYGRSSLIVLASYSFRTLENNLYSGSLTNFAHYFGSSHVHNLLLDSSHMQAHNDHPPLFHSSPSSTR